MSNDGGRSSGMKSLVEKLEDFERILKVSLPNVYRQFLLGCDVGVRFPFELNFKGVDGFKNSTLFPNFFGFCENPELDLEKNYEFYTLSNRVVGHVLPIAGDFAGNLLCIGVAQNCFGEIFFWDHELEVVKSQSDAVVKISSSLDTLIAGDINE